MAGDGLVLICLFVELAVLNTFFATHLFYGYSLTVNSSTIQQVKHLDEPDVPHSTLLRGVLEFRHHNNIDTLSPCRNSVLVAQKPNS